MELTKAEEEKIVIFLTEMNSKFDLLLEGLAAFDKKFDRKIEELSQKVEHNSFMIDTLNKKIDAVAVDLKAHRSDTEAHCGVYRVNEG